MYETLMLPFVTRTFPSRAKERYLCQFREHDQSIFTDHGRYQYLDTAMSFVSLVVRFVDLVAEGRDMGTVVFPPKSNLTATVR